jgi:protease-4
MKNLPRILSKVHRDYWCITPQAHQAIVASLDRWLESPTTPSPAPQPDPEPEARPGFFSVGPIAVIPVHGILGKHLSMLEMECGGCSMDAVSAMLDRAMAAPTITTILLDIDSPGGTVTGTPELAKAIANAAQEKRVVAFTDSDCCSGALWLASQAEFFYATPSSEIGSVGVRMLLLDYSRALENEGVKVNAITSGKYKLAGADFKPLTDDERAMFQSESDRIYNQFKAAIQARRNVPDDMLEGQIYRAELAVQNGFIDGITDSFGALVTLLQSDIR